jgi:RecB family exonuclease
MSFCQQLAARVRKYPVTHWPTLLLFVPTVRVAARVRALLSEDFTGVLPAIVPLKGTPELAELLGLESPTAVDGMVARMEIARVLRVREDIDLFDAAAPAEVLEGERLWRRVEGLYTTLNRLTLHDLSVRELRAAVPAHMVGLWVHQADTLLRVARHMERWLESRNEIFAGAAERRILEEAARVLARDDSPWIPIVAGVVDGIPAALEIMRVAAERGEVLLPELGAATAELAGALEIAATPLPLPAAPYEAAVAASDWDEAWMVALAVRRAVENGDARVAVVSASRALLARIAGILEGWQIAATVGGAGCLAETPLGREATAALHWGTRGRMLSQWLELMETRPLELEEWPTVLRELQRLQGEDFWLEAGDWQAVMQAVLAEAPVVNESHSGVVLLGPLEARLLDFDTVIACGCVEGTWPSHSADAWLSEPHLRALQLPDSAHKALLAGTELESVLHSGSRRVIVTYAHTSEGKETVRSRFLAGYACTPDTELAEIVQVLRRGGTPAEETLGVFVPQGSLWPKKWSASFVEAMLACPYRALGERVLKLAAPEPLVPLPDARTAGLLVHRWLERIGTEAPKNQGTEDLTARMLEIAEEELMHEPPVVRAIWRGKFAKLVPALVAQWQADGRTVETVERRLTREVGAVTVTATLDRVEADAEGKVILDYKTGTPPAWSKVAAGIKPQLALEAWLLGPEVQGVEYWHLKGFGTSPLNISRAGNGARQSLESLVAPVKDGVARLVETYGEGAAFAAVPDRQGGGLLATGHCETCELAGVCRRKGARYEVRGYEGINDAE